MQLDELWTMTVDALYTRSSYHSDHEIPSFSLEKTVKLLKTTAPPYLREKAQGLLLPFLYVCVFFQRTRQKAFITPIN